MKKALLTLALIATLASPLYANSFTFKVEKSIVHINFEVGPGQIAWCTGFVVGVNRVISAAHCLPDAGSDFPLIVQDLPTKVLKQDNSLALIEVLGPLNMPALTIRSEKADIGESAVLFGYGYGAMKVMFRHVAADENGDVIVDGPIVHGMSGGPVVDEYGKVIGLNQGTIPELGKASGVKEIRKFLGIK